MKLKIVCQKSNQEPPEVPELTLENINMPDQINLQCCTKCELEVIKIEVFYICGELKRKLALDSPIFFKSLILDENWNPLLNQTRESAEKILLHYNPQTNRWSINNTHQHPTGC